MTKRELLCSDCGAKFSSPQVLAVHVIEQHHPNLILESSTAKPQPPNHQPQSQNAPPLHVQPIGLNQPPNVQAFNINPPSMPDEREIKEQKLGNKK